MDAAVPLPVIVNRSGGTASALGDRLEAQLREAFAAAGCDIALELIDGSEIEAAARRHATARRFAIGGGDGTVGTAAHVAADAGCELAVLPLGTRNHFARQIGVPLDLPGAAALAANGTALPVDLGHAGTRSFVNNASAGAYVDLVHEREATRLPGVLGLGYGAFRALAKLRSRRFDLTLDGAAAKVDTPLLFVGNNRYEVSGGNPTERASLEDGDLSIYAVAPLSRLSLTAAALRILAGRPRMHRDFALDRLAREVVIDGPGQELEITLDGDACCLPLPLTLSIRPKALAVVRPPQANG